MVEEKCLEKMEVTIGVVIGKEMSIMIMMSFVPFQMLPKLKLKHKHKHKHQFLVNHLQVQAQAQARAAATMAADRDFSVVRPRHSSSSSRFGARAGPPMASSSPPPRTAFPQRNAARRGVRRCSQHDGHHSG